MYFFLSGEGASDLGNFGLENKFQPGPLAIIADQIIERHHRYSFLESQCVDYIHPMELNKIKPTLRRPKRSPQAPREKTPDSESYLLHRKDAQALAHAAVTKMKDKDDGEFVAVLFRDANSPDEKNWNDNRNSMLTGFRVAGIDGHGVAAVARPISEAWWLNALDRKANPKQPVGNKYDGMRRGGNEGDHRLKKDLGEDGRRAALVGMVQNGEIDYQLIDSPSFLAFRKDFEKAVGLEYLHHTETAS